MNTQTTKRTCVEVSKEEFKVFNKDGLRSTSTPLTSHWYNDETKHSWCKIDYRGNTPRFYIWEEQS